MLSYQHIYHAGNFADVHKHALLARTVATLKARHPKLCVIDTHAGRGMYDLSAPEAQKKAEYANGIAALWTLEGGAAREYLDIVKKYNPDGELRRYPGSPRIVRDILRAGDRLVLAELHPGENDALQSSMVGSANTVTLRKNGFDVMEEDLPPAERRGLAVIDPPYEIKTDYAELPRRVQKVWKKWPQGSFFIWYPILTDAPHLEMLTLLRKTGIGNILVSELRMSEMPSQGFAMYGSGVAIVNPPFPEAVAAEVAGYVAAHLPAPAVCDTFWLANRGVDPATGLVAV